MKSVHRSWVFLLILCGTLSGCVTGSVLNVPGELSRKAPQVPAGMAGAPAVAVLDFSWAGAPSQEIGRDFDLVRPIVWKGDPGKSMAGLIVDALAEKGIAAVRAAGEADIPAGVPARVWGRVEGFRVNVKRVGTLKVDAEASATLKIQGAGPNVPPGWASTVSSTYWYTDAFSTPEGVQQALIGAANAAAEEAVRRLVEAGVVAVPAPAEGGETERKR